MKRQYHTLHSRRGTMMRSLLFALLSGSILLCSCADDLASSASSRQLTFTPTVSSSWNQGTRSVSGPDVPQSTVTALEGYSRPLYLHTYYTDSIASPGSDSKTITRAAPITANAMFDKFGVSATYTTIRGARLRVCLSTSTTLPQRRLVKHTILTIHITGQGEKAK